MSWTLKALPMCTFTLTCVSFLISRQRDFETEKQRQNRRKAEEPSTVLKSGKGKNRKRTGMERLKLKVKDSGMDPYNL